MRLQLDSNSQYFAFSNLVAKQQYRQSKTFIIQAHGGRVLSENKLKRKRHSDRKKKRSERSKASREKRARK